jgi:hypothetical protein
MGTSGQLLVSLKDSITRLGMVWLDRSDVKSVAGSHFLKFKFHFYFELFKNGVRPGLRRVRTPKERNIPAEFSFRGDVHSRRGNCLFHSGSTWFDNLANFSTPQRNPGLKRTDANILKICTKRL